MEDRLLVTAFLLTRSETVFRQLYRKHSHSIFRIALQMVNKDIATAEDIVQEAWLRAVDQLPHFRWQSSFRTWLSGIAINCAREALRKRSAWSEHVDLQYLPAQDERIDLQGALAMLPKGYREVLLLHDMEGYTHNEIAGILDISEGTSKSQLFHARRAVKRMLN